MKNKVLIVRLGAIGDVVMASPMLEALEREHPGVQVDWLVGRVAAPVLRCLDAPNLRIIEADEIALFRGSLPERLRALFHMWSEIGFRRYQRIYNLNGDWRYGLIPLWTHGRRIGHTKLPGVRPTIPGRHASSEYVRMVAGRDADFPLPAYPRLDLPDLPAEVEARLAGMARPVAISPGGAKNVMREEGLRRWPAERYLELVRALKSAGHALMLVGGPGEEWVSERFGGLVDLDLVGRLDLPGTMAALRRASVLVTHDSGPLHLGDIVGVPVVGLFGPTMPSEKEPIHSAHVTLWGGGTLGCRPCYDGRRYADCKMNRCLAEISVDAVLEAVELLVVRAAQGNETHALEKRA